MPCLRRCTEGPLGPEAKGSGQRESGRLRYGAFSTVGAPRCLSFPLRLISLLFSPFPSSFSSPFSPHFSLSLSRTRISPLSPLLSHFANFLAPRILSFSSIIPFVVLFYFLLTRFYVAPRSNVLPTLSCIYTHRR